MLGCQSAFPCALDLCFLNIDLQENVGGECTLAFLLSPITTIGDDMLQQEAKGARENAAALNPERSGEYGCDKQPSLYMSIIFILIDIDQPIVISVGNS